MGQFRLTRFGAQKWRRLRLFRACFRVRMIGRLISIYQVIEQNGRELTEIGVNSALITE